MRGVSFAHGPGTGADDDRALSPLDAGSHVEVARRYPRQPLEAYVPEEVEIALQHHPRDQARDLAQVLVHPRQ